MPTSPRRRPRRAIRTAAALWLLAASGLGARSEAQAAPSPPIVPPIAPAEHRRGTEQTFLTYPEWFLVHSPAEFAAFTRERDPSDFPFLGHIGQFWSSYRAVSRETKRAGYPLNGAYHLMIVVIGTSTTVEYALRSAYETLVGRLAELSRRNGMTDEDRYAARVAQEYVDFIRVQPWYEFDFKARLGGLWRDTSLTGPDLLRKWERKYILTTEYLAKGLYGGLIRKATRATYEVPREVTAVVVDQPPRDLGPALPQLALQKRLPGGAALITVPRYEAFQLYARALARQGLSFEEIAGNRTVILVTLLAPDAWRDRRESHRILFTQPLLTRPGLRRLAIVVPIHDLAQALREFDREPIHLEHIYDY